MRELPSLPSSPVCPAAFPIAGASPERRGCVCRVMQREHEDDAGVNMTAGALQRVRESQGGVLLTLATDPSSVANFCHGDAVPVVNGDDRAQARASYTYCPVFQAEKDRIAAGRDELVAEPEPDPVSWGVVEESGDPWEQARRGLDELAPQPRAA